MKPKDILSIIEWMTEADNKPIPQTSDYTQPAHIPTKKGMSAPSKKDQHIQQIIGILQNLSSEAVRDLLAQASQLQSVDEKDEASDDIPDAAPDAGQDVEDFSKQMEEDPQDLSEIEGDEPVAPTAKPSDYEMSLFDKQHKPAQVALNQPAQTGQPVPQVDPNATRFPAKPSGPAPQQQSSTNTGTQTPKKKKSMQVKAESFSLAGFFDLKKK